MKCIALVIYGVLQIGAIASSDICYPRKLAADRIVCVCNSFQCSQLPAISRPGSGTYVMYSSSKFGLRFHRTVGKFTTKRNLNPFLRVSVDSSTQYQTLTGFGGAFTDSTGINILSLSTDLQDKLMRAYYGPEGVDYAMGRVPMGATDFSPRYYSYVSSPDNENLDSFQLQPEDFNYKIPFIRQAMNLSSYNLKLITAPWTAPPWMKSTNRYNERGTLLTQFYQAFANYYIKFLDAYDQQGINFWAVSSGNEPYLGLIGMPLPDMGWTFQDQRKWFTQNLGPTIRNSKYAGIKLFIHDDLKLFLLKAQYYFRSNETLQYIDGVAYHWYMHEFTPKFFLKFGQTKKKPLMQLSTESSEFFRDEKDIGSWKHAEDYINDILDDFSYDAIGWLDWNMALNTDGGPVYTNETLSSPIFVNASNNEYLLQPMYYALAHFSKFLPPDTVRIKTSTQLCPLKIMGFKRPDNGKVLIVYNEHAFGVSLHVKDDSNGWIKTSIAKNSINTIYYY